MRHGVQTYEQQPSRISCTDNESGEAMVGLFSRTVVAATVRMPKWFVGWVSRRYVAGSTLDDALRIMKRLSDEGACFTVDVLGEEISNMEEAQFFLDEYVRVLQAIRSTNLDANLSIKPTAFGLLIDKEKGMANIEKLVRMANEHDMFVRLDMEDHRVTTDTIQVVIDLHKQGLTNVGTVLQGRLFRTLDDINHLETELGPAADYRVCKGIYLEPDNIAYTGYQDIVDATNASIDRMLAAGAYCSIASHDLPVINHATSALESFGMGPGIVDPRTNSGDARAFKGPGYEFQMLLGVRGPLRRKLAAAGHRTRVYIPYGEKWYEYSIRRLKENPTVGAQVAKAFLMPWTNRP
ncbi:proline dehydrogenase family protein [Candidatus Poseidoniales archaeon]|jgi:proline dehydrogenase|nr:MAG: Proline dehydrogenase [uncultured Candidatus Poseidoniales archaeon]MDA7740835.1 proline dehydrogenase family protein [Euryarchaeota archaeon]MDA8724509.1 proline dehydrogenase family protein [Candidatus Poseidoniales archaeon]MDB2320071.1 proline dehydrogenase family protein [Candidatus Poseidoniales archaeon]